MIDKKFADIESLDDNYIGRELMKVKGIGQWTVDMFLIFSLARPDVFPTGDLVIQKGYAKLYNMKINRPKCGCGNTSNHDGYCDGSHLNK